MGNFQRGRHLEYDEPEIKCACGNRALLIPAWKEQNPGRRFVCCVKENGCLFWDWYDPKPKKPKYAYYSQLLKQLHEENKMLLADNSHLRKQSMGHFTEFGESSDRRSGVHSAPMHLVHEGSGEFVSGEGVKLKLIVVKLLVVKFVNNRA